MPPRAPPGRPRRNNGGASNPRASSTVLRISERPPGPGQLPGSFPERAIVPLEYVSVGRVSAGVITYGNYVFATSSLFDPDNTGTGHQPREFDTWASVYQRYRVHHVIADVTVRQRASHGVEVYLITTNEPTPVTPADFPGEQPRSTFLGITASNQPAVRRRVTIKPHQIMGITMAQFLANENTQAQITASPAEGTFLQLYVNQLDATTVGDFEYSVRLTFYAEMFDRRVVSPSSVALPRPHASAARPTSPAVLVEREEVKESPRDDALGTIASALLALRR